MTLQLKAREMYKPDTTRLAQFWSTFQVIGVTDHGVRTSHWYSVVTPIHELCYVYLGHCTDHQRSTASIQDTWCSLYGSRLPTVAAITGHRWSNLGQATWKHLLLYLLNYNCIPALLVAVFLPCLVIIGWVSNNFTNIKESCKWH